MPVIGRGRISNISCYLDPDKRNTKIKVYIPEDNFTLTLLRNKKYITDFGLISWGDGRKGSLKDLYIHTYSKAGVYEIQGHFIFGLGYEPTASLKKVLIGVDQLSDKCFDLSKAFFDCKKLEYVNLSSVDVNKIKSLNNMITGCDRLDKNLFYSIIL